MNEAALRATWAGRGVHSRLSLALNRPSAVLVALEPERGVWLTRRSGVMPNHAGQVSLPGGKIEPEDASVEAAAMREAYEEIGLDPAGVEILGRLDDYITGTGVHIAPVVALVPRNVDLHVASDEVEAIFCLPFAGLMDRTLPRARKTHLHGADRVFYVWPHDCHVIWGATAEILRKLAIQLRGAG